MNLINETIKSFLTDYKIDNPDLVYLIGFSGGYDSMCLLHCLKNICNNSIIAIHLNHNWRGEESDSEEKNCQDFCKNIGVEFYSEKLSSDIDKNETDARIERYEFFKRCSQKFNSRIIFTAHNKNDNAETLLYRIAKGTGITGLSGINPQRDIYYRPLLNIEREDIENYCKMNNLTPNKDSSNDDIIHKRNLIRKNIIPQLKEINPKVLDSLNRLSTSAFEDTQIVDEYISKIKKDIVKNNKYSTTGFFNQSKAVQLRLLYDLISPFVIQNYDRERFLTVLDFIEQNKNSKSGKVCSITTDKNLFINNRYFTLITNEKKNSNVLKINKTGLYEFNGKRITIEEYDKSAETKKDAILVDLSEFSFDFELRTRQDGDFIQPYKLNGHQKLKKYLNNRKIPNYEKDNLILITYGKEVLLVTGIGLSDKIKVVNEPTHIIRIEDR